MKTFACIYCGNPVPDGCPHPNQFFCCREIGHVEELEAENDQQAHQNDIDQETGCTYGEMHG